MRLQVYLCYPLFDGDLRKNIMIVDELTFYAQSCGVAAVSTHECFREVDLNNKNEISDALASGCALLWNSHEIWVFAKRITDRMRKEISLCETIRKPIKYVNENKLRKGIVPK